MKGLENMTALILAEAENAAKSLRAEAKIEAESIVASYKRQADEETAAQTAKIAQEDRSARERAESSARQILRNARLKAKSELLDAAFDAALQSLLDLPDAERLELYTTIFRSVLAEQLAVEKTAAENDRFGEFTAVRQYTILLSERDRTSIGDALLTAVRAMAKSADKQIALSDQTVSISGGFVLVCGDVELSCTLSGYMERIRSRIEGEVCQILFA